MYDRGAATLKAIGNPAPEPGRNRFPNLPPEQADDVQRKLTEFCFGDTWGREGSHIDLKTRRLLTIAALVSQGKERQLRGHIGGPTRSPGSPHTHLSDRIRPEGRCSHASTHSQSHIVCW
jgi:alkylhydroperoxidase/carboxymuconolactone decarboxylase family protein YurZ